MDVIETFLAKKKKKIHTSSQAFPLECRSNDGIVGYCDGRDAAVEH
jgi:hypothetical protein